MLEYQKKVSVVNGSTFVHQSHRVRNTILNVNDSLALKNEDLPLVCGARPTKRNHGIHQKKIRT